MWRALTDEVGTGISRGESPSKHKKGVVGQEAGEVGWMQIVETFWASHRKHVCTFLSVCVSLFSF
jgi:hypothetical protein